MYVEKIIDGELIGVLRVADDSFIPNDMDNNDWVQYLSWKEEQIEET